MPCFVLVRSVALLRGLIYTNMKSLSHGKVGNIKMRGRKTCSAGCTCCDVQNFKDREREKDLEKEIIEFAELYVKDTHRRFEEERAELVERILSENT